MSRIPYTRAERNERSRLHRIRKSELHDLLSDSPRWSFSYNDDEWECPLQKMRCIHHPESTHNQCRRESTYTLPYCWQHLKSVSKLRIGVTTMRDSDGNPLTFQGLFVCDESKANDVVIFKRNDILAPYLGQILTRSQQNARYPGETEVVPYGFGLIDAACVRSVAAYGNHCLPTNQNCANNSTIITSGPIFFPVLQATRDIRNNTEVFVDYGDMYFHPTSVHEAFETRPAREYLIKNYKCKTKR